MYKLTDNPHQVIRLEDSTTIPRSHRWWGAYEVWLADGNAPEPAVSIDALRAQALAILTNWEIAERAAGMDYIGNRWLTTPAALQDIRDALLAGLVPNDVWIDTNRNAVPTTLEQLQALWAACVNRGAAIYQRRLVMEAEIATLDRAALEQFQPGWPAADKTQ
ncbi:DUF4376 domain-containing protein [Jeongeupia naejangsanensis]|uniref:DUF4376 domain-containing protein n=1 Tax=Jeongeupia naejangsanensis TaxID=613195 RepID=A0ABS2BHA6_9NEIS|nr:DUF4376 domain-containing protein [Jeongeupia naejangsanensis]MBM3115003.1 DUF4376 domain-containing protein [Jeongeupia naejangsanensis]